jgi:hypothetical protein
VARNLSAVTDNRVKTELLFQKQLLALLKDDRLSMLQFKPLKDKRGQPVKNWLTS